MAETKHYDVFISYSRKDYVDDRGNVIPGNDVSKIMSALSEAGISYWFDKEGVIHGEDFGEKILKYIKQSKIFVYLSTSAANESEWTRKEIASAVMYKKKIIPVRIDESPYHDSVMFRIADLDYINYASNPKKSREELVESILRYKAEEQAAAARREAEEQRRREEQERQHKQQEDLRRRQQQADELRAEISRTEEECSELEKTLLLKQHDLGVVNMELESKRKHLEEQKLQMNAILYAEEEPDPKKDDNRISPTQQSEDLGFEFLWSHPKDSFLGMWKKIWETMAIRHKILNVVLSLTIFLIIVLFLSFFSIPILSGSIHPSDLPACTYLLLYFCALWQLLLNKRSGMILLFLTPILVIPIIVILEPSSYEIFTDIIELLSIWLFTTILLGIFFIFRSKGGGTALSLLEGKYVHALQINKQIVFYVVFSVFLLIACSKVNRKVYEASVPLTDELNKLRADRDRILAERDSLQYIKDSMAFTLKRYEQRGASFPPKTPLPVKNHELGVNAPH